MVRPRGATCPVTHREPDISTLPNPDISIVPLHVCVVDVRLCHLWEFGSIEPTLVVLASAPLTSRPEADKRADMLQNVGSFLIWAIFGLGLSSCFFFGQASSPLFPPEKGPGPYVISEKDGCFWSAFETDSGWNSFAACGRRETKIARQPQSLPLGLLFVHEGCTGYGWDYHQNLLVQCESDPARWAPNSLGMLKQSPELVFTFGDCAGYRFEYMATWYFMRCGLELAEGKQKHAEGAFEFLFSQDGCDAYRFKHEGRRYLIRCGYSSQASGKGSLEGSTTKVLDQDGCRGYTFSDSGSHFFARCDNTPVTYMLREGNCTTNSRSRCSIGEGSVAVSTKVSP